MQRTVTICNKLGLHMRAASKLVHLAEEFDAEVTLNCNELEADAKSLLDVLQLAGTQGTEITISTTSDSEEDAAEALEQICQLINNRFDEPE